VNFLFYPLKLSKDVLPVAMKEKILQAQTDEDILVKLIEQFAPLLTKYAKKLESEDAYDDLQLKFIQLILQFNPIAMRSSDDPYILSYFRRFIHNYYTYLSKQEKLARLISPISALSNDDMSDNDADFMDKQCPPEEKSYLYDEFDLLYKNLTAYEAHIIIAHFYFQYATREIAKHYGVSPSAISQAKSNALKKLYKFLIKGDELGGGK
jgi:RNA polymerase sigma factor (sigma-70 family)